MKIFSVMKIHAKEGNLKKLQRKEIGENVCMTYAN